MDGGRRRGGLLGAEICRPERPGLSGTYRRALNACRAERLGAVSSAAVVATPDAGSRFALSGVVALHSGQGAALIAVDGQAPKAFKVGQVVADGWVLQSLEPRQARLGAARDSHARITLDMPAIAKP